tara:strand:+ start:211 stop:657 length:447 start_codon:yes stop_codon:yes gene_type:complete
MLDIKHELERFRNGFKHLNALTARVIFATKDYKHKLTIYGVTYRNVQILTVPVYDHIRGIDTVRPMAVAQTNSAYTDKITDAAADIMIDMFGEDAMKARIELLDGLIEEARVREIRKLQSYLAKLRDEASELYDSTLLEFGDQQSTGE